MSYDAASSKVPQEARDQRGEKRKAKDSSRRKIVGQKPYKVPIATKKKKVAAPPSPPSARSHQPNPVREGLSFSSVVIKPQSDVTKVPSGPCTTTAKGGASSPLAGSSDSALRRTSSGKPAKVSGGQRGTSIDTTVAQMEADVPVGERRNKTPVYVTGVQNTRSFLRWLREQTRGDCAARIKGDKLILVPATADCFRATIRALRSLDAAKGVNFHTYCLPEERCSRILLKNLGQRMPVDDVREELELLGIQPVSVLQLRSQRRDADPAKDRPLTPHFIVTVARGPLTNKVRALDSLCGLRIAVETYQAPKGPLQCKNCQRFGHTQRNCGYPARCVACGGPHTSDGQCVKSKELMVCANCNSNHCANYKGCAKFKEQKAASAKRAGGAKAPVKPAPVAVPRRQPVVLTPEQESLGPEWNHVGQGGRIAKAKVPTKPADQPKEAQRVLEKRPAEQPKPAKASPLPSAVSVPTSQPTQSVLDMITDLTQDLPLATVTGLTRHVLRQHASFPTGEDRTRAVLNVILSYVAQNGCTA